MRVSQRTSVSGQYVCSVFNNKALTASCSNCQGSLLQDIFRYARYPPQVLQVEIHPYLTQEPIVELAKTLGVAVTAYSSFGPQGWIEISMDKGLPSLFTHDVVTSISKKNQKSTHLLSLLLRSTSLTRLSQGSAQVLLRWSTQRGIAVIPKSTDQDKIDDNLANESFDLTDAELTSITGLNLNVRVSVPDSMDTVLF